MAAANQQARVDLLEPREAPLEVDDVASAVLFALSQPPHVDVNEILVRPSAQPM